MSKLIDAHAAGRREPDSLKTAWMIANADNDPGFVSAADDGPDFGVAISPIEEVIEEIKSGRAIILVDRAGADQHGDLVIAARYADANAVNFMARYARGLICLALDAERVAALELRPMSISPDALHRAPFTVSIEAREGVTTGISAYDRARTIEVATSPDMGPSDLVTPGHVFPLAARAGGVLACQGHAEAVTDLVRLAGLNAAGVTCEVMSADGSVARFEELVSFATKHGLKIGSVADLVEYRQRIECRVEETYSGPFLSRHGSDFTIRVFANLIDGSEHVALTRGSIIPDRETLVRVHQVDLAIDLLDHALAPENLLRAVMRAVASHEGPAAIILVRQPAGTRIADRLRGKADPGPCRLGRRECAVAARILDALGVGEVRLIGADPAEASTLAGEGLRLHGGLGLDRLAG